MLTAYIQQAMRHAHYEVTETGKIFGAIPCCKGTWAEADSVEECRDELQTVLEDWILLGLHLGHRLPVIDGITLNKSKRAKRAIHAQTH